MIVRLAWILLVALLGAVVALEFVQPSGGRALVGVERSTVPDAPSGTNLALGRPYSLDPAPNYVTPTPVAQGVLTDGKLGRSSHWVTGASHGWNMASPAIVDLGLETVSRLSEVRVYTTRSPSVGVEWPSVAHLFVSRDGKTFRTWLEPGTLVKTGTDGRSIERGFFRFDLKGVNAVRIAVAVFGMPFLFLDEIEAFGTPPVGGEAAQAGLGPAFERNQLKAAVRDARIGGLLEPIRARLTAEGRLPAALAAGEPAPWYFRNEGPVGSTPTTPGAGEPANTSCTASRIWPWQSFRPGKAALQPMPSAFGGTDFTIALQPAWFAWQIVNRSPAPQRLRTASEFPAGTRPFVLAYLPTVKSAIAGDALLPLPAALEILPGESLTLMLEVTAGEPGSRAVVATLDCGEKPLVLEAALTAVEDTRLAPLSHFTTWAYPKDAMKKALECKPGFERKYGIDTAAIGPDALQDLGDPAMARRLVDQLTLSRGAARVLLFMNIRTHEVFRKGADEAALETAASRWLGQVQAAVSQSGFDGEVLLYPIDEFEAQDLDWFARAKRALQKTALEGPIPALNGKVPPSKRTSPVRFFGTIAQTKFLGVARDLDVASIGVLVNSLGERSDLYSHEFYIGQEPAKELSPSRFYFAAPIGAAVRGAPGFGIWAMTDSSGVDAYEQAWTDIGIGERDFGMMYVDAEGCPVPTLRLAAVGAGRTAERILRNCWAKAPADSGPRRLLEIFGRVGESEGKDLGDDALDPLTRELERCGT